MSKHSFIPIDVKKKCVAMKSEGLTPKQIYDQYFVNCMVDPMNATAFKSCLNRWEKKTFPDDTTLVSGTYDGFMAHDATVQISGSGEIVQAWIKQKATDMDPEIFINSIQKKIEPYNYDKRLLNSARNMLEIPLFDMHWGIAFFDDYSETLDEILEVIYSHEWDRIVIPFGQDFFHNDSVVNGQTTKGTQIEKVDMIKAVKDGQRFMYTIIDAAIEQSDKVEVMYSPGNHDQSTAWMFIQVLLERYGASIVDDSMEFRKVIAYGDNAIMITHGNAKRDTANNLAHVFTIKFTEEFANSKIREVHAGHLHTEIDSDVFGVMVRRVASGNLTDKWSDKEDFIGVHKRFMLFEYSLNKLSSIHYMKGAENQNG